MITLETRRSQVSIHGRVADERTRADLGPRRYRAALRNYRRHAIQKHDGYFAFADLPPSPPDYEVELSGREFQERVFTVPWPGPGAAALEPAGEDELQVIVTAVAGNRVSFASQPFVPYIVQGAEVLAPGGFATTLAEELAGADIDGAELQAVGPIVDADVLRIVRSTRVLLRPGPYYRFPATTTLVAIRVVEDAPGAAPLAAAQIRITAVNGAAVSSAVVAGATLFRAELPGPPPVPFLIGTDAARTTRTNARGDAVFYYAPTTPVTSLTMAVSRTGFTTQTPTIAVAPAQRSFALVQLVHD
jgi:hypothetical protein